MPEVSFFLDADDERALICFVVEHGGRIVAATQSSPTYREITDWNEYNAARADERLFFILFDSYARCPLRTVPIDTGYHAGKYAIVQRTGGPAIDLFASTQYEEDHNAWISDGVVGYHTTFRDTTTDHLERVPDALVTQFRLIVAHLRIGSTVIRGRSGRRYIAGPHTYNAIQSGEMRLSIPGLSTT